MNNLHKLNPKEIYNEYELSGKIVLPDPYRTNFKLFVDHILPVLAKIKLEGTDLISTTKTLQGIPSEGISTPNGDFSYDAIRGMLELTYKIPRSKLIRDTRKNPHLAGLTPLLMYAHKLYNDIQYKYWDSSDANIHVALGSFLYKALEFQQEYPSIQPVGRDQVVRSALINGKIWSSYPKNLRYSYTEDGTEEKGETITYSREWLILDCQFWLANAEVRDTEAMLLDVRNFGRIPEALDVKAPSISKTDPRNASW